MKIYLCFLRNDARSGVDTQFLGVASTESLALNLCATAVVARSTYSGKQYVNRIGWETPKNMESNWDNLQKEQSTVLKTIENFSLDLINDIDQLNEKLQPFFRKIGKASRWCEISEVEMDQPLYLD